MKLFSFQVTFQEVPNEISLCFSITGCPLRCKGCHTPELRSPYRGSDFNLSRFLDVLEKYRGLFTCVLFMGGEWFEKELIEMLSFANRLGVKTALYTGEENVSDNLKRELNFLKTGPFIESLGGLVSKDSNQTFVNIKTGEKLNHLFWRED